MHVSGLRSAKGRWALAPTDDRSTSTSKHQFEASVHTQASHRKAASRFNNMLKYSALWCTWSAGCTGVGNRAVRVARSTRLVYRISHWFNRPQVTASLMTVGSSVPNMINGLRGVTALLEELRSIVSHIASAAAAYAENGCNCISTA